MEKMSQPRPVAGAAIKLRLFGVALAGIAAVGLGAAWLLQSQGASSAATGVLLVAAAAFFGVTLLGLYRLAVATRDGGAATLAGLHLAVVLGATAVAELLAARIGVIPGLIAQVAGVIGSGWFAWRQFRAAPRYRLAATGYAALVANLLLVVYLARQGFGLSAVAIGGVTLMAVGYLAGIAGLRALLRGPGPIAVARTVVDEAIRMKVALVLGILFVLSLPILPLLLDSGERLSYRVQFFLTWALGGTGFLLGLLTVFLGCGSFCGDIDSNRIHLTLTKPLGRLEYLAGKWLGLTAVNLLLVGLAGMAIYTSTLLLSRTDALGEIDRRALDEQVLTARLSQLPTHPAGEAFDKTLDTMLLELEKEAPDAFKADREGTRNRIRGDYFLNWHTLKPDRVAEFVFSGLGDAKQQSDRVHLRVRPYGDVPGIDHADVKFAMWLNDRPYPYRDNEHVDYVLPGGMTHTLELPVEAIDKEGRLKVTLANRNLIIPGATQPVWISLPPGKGLQLLHTVGSFTPNYALGLVILWLKLTLVAAVAVTAATFLGFPMAVLTSLFVFIAALGSGFIGDSLELSTGMDQDQATVLQMAGLRWMIFRDFIVEGNYWEAFKTMMAVVGELFMTLVPPFDRYDAVSAVAGGMKIGLGMLGDCLLRVGVVAPLLLGLLGWWLFEQRDLVRSNS